MALKFTKEEVKLYLTGHLRMATRSSTGESYLKPSTPKGKSSDAKRIRHRLWYLKNVEKRREYTRQWRLKNPTKTYKAKLKPADALRQAALEATAELPKPRRGRPPKVHTETRVYATPTGTVTRVYKRKLLTPAQKKAIKSAQNARYHRANKDKIALRHRAKYQASLKTTPNLPDHVVAAVKADPKHQAKVRRYTRRVVQAAPQPKVGWLRRLLGVF